MRGYVDTLRGVVDGERFPALQAVIDAGVFDRADPPDEELAFGLDRILDGVEVLVRRRLDRVAQDRRRRAAAGMSSRRNASTRPPCAMTLRAISSTTP